MRLPVTPTLVPAARRLCAIAALLALATGCTGTTPSAGPPGTPAVAPTPVIPTPSPASEAGSYWLRLITTQALPPVNVFAVGPTAVITGDGRYLVPGAVMAIFPGPLVPPYVARQVSEAGREQIVAWADELGLLSGETDFTGGAMMPGGVAGRIEMTVDGRHLTLTGVPDLTEPDAEPGSPAAFGELWRRLTTLPETLPGELGPEEPWAPEGYALLVGPAPAPEAGLTGEVADWPLDAPLATLGGPVEDGTFRCAVIEGADAAVLRPALEGANQLTQWVQDPETSATFGLTVRPIVSGENPCAEVFGF